MNIEKIQILIYVEYEWMNKCVYKIIIMKYVYLYNMKFQWINYSWNKYIKYDSYLINMNHINFSWFE